MENLNKENFFNEMTKKYPGAMDKFHTWINAYKKEVHWEHLFNPKFRSRYVSGHAETRLTDDSSTKFHDIPYEMQFGILMKFAQEVLLTGNDYNTGISLEEMKELFSTCLAAVQEGILNADSDGN